MFPTKGFVKEKTTQAARATYMTCAVKDEPKAGHQLYRHQNRRNYHHGAILGKLERMFRILKCRFGYPKVRYGSISKNGAQDFSLLALAKLCLARRTLAAT